MVKPASCHGCPLATSGTGFLTPSLAGPDGYHVALIGDMPDNDESEPFSGRAGFRLTRLIEWAGFERAKFDIYHTIWCYPEEGQFEQTPLEIPATLHCRTAHWEKLLDRATVVVPMGNTAAHRFIPGSGHILSSRGYLYPRQDGGAGYVLPTVHPSFIVGGQSKWSAAFIADLQKAVTVAQHGIPPQFTDYVLDPSPAVALAWARRYREVLAQDRSTRLAFDIETPGKPDEDEDTLDTSEDLPDATWNIFRIGFSYRGLTGLSIPWEPPFFAAIRTLLESEGDKIVWNAGFDVPRVRRAGFAINGLIHDGMVAWHILHSDLPKRLGFAATFCCPWQPAWKHLSGSRPAYYNATDADVELRCMDRIESELRSGGLWNVYQRDILDLEPVLAHMQRRGMGVDHAIRVDRARKLAERIKVILGELESLIPIEARRIEHIYVKTPSDITGLSSRPGLRNIKSCARCALLNPRKDHFKSFVRKVNPCAGATIQLRDVPVTEYYRLASFKVSRNLLIAYHNHLQRPLPLVWDRKLSKRKVSFDEEQMKKLILKYPDDKLYPTVLEYRGLDKLAGTYIGRPEVIDAD